MISERSIRRIVEQFRLPEDLELPSECQRDMQVILDASASMACGDGSKEQRARELAITVLRLCVKSGRRGVVWAVRGQHRDRLIEAADSDRLAKIPFDGTVSLAHAWPANQLAATGLRVVISDYLFPADVGSLVQQAAAGAAKLVLLQLLDPWEAAPEPAGQTSLMDVESAEVLEVTLDSATVACYAKRLSSLQERYQHSCAEAGAVWVSVSAATELDEICCDRMVPLGLLRDAV